MSGLRSELLRTLEARGFIHQCTDTAALDAAALDGPITAYVGYDCTADSLHIGHLVSIMMLRHLQRAGHKPIALVGGGTTKVGDPSGKDESRQLLTQEQIDANKRGIEGSLARFLDFDLWVFDERADCFAAGQYADATRLSGDYAQLARALDTGRDVYAVLLNRDFPSDVATLRALADRPPRFLGMMGSRKRIGEVLSALGDATARLPEPAAR